MSLLQLLGSKTEKSPKNAKLLSKISGVMPCARSQAMPLKKRSVSKFGKLSLIGIGVGLVLASCGGSYYNAEVIHADAVSQLEESNHRLTSVTQTLSFATNSAQVLLENTDAEDVADKSVLLNLDEAIDQAFEILEVTAYEHECAAIFDSPAILAGIETNTEIQAEATKAYTNVYSAIADVKDSVLLKDVQDAYLALQTNLDEAKSLLNEIKDDTTRENLAKTISEADEVLVVDPSVNDAASYEKKAQTLIAEIQELVGSYEKQKASEATAASTSSTTSSSYSSSLPTNSNSSSSDISGAWYVSYTAYTQSNLDAGYVCEWKSGYYIAHSWSNGGVKIASKPTYVVVDGVTYKYVSSKLVSTETTWSQVEGFVHANNGIGFQTCSGGYYLVAHYEPI